MRRTVDRRTIGVFTVIAYLGAWAAVSPLVLTGFRRTGNELGQTTLTQVCIAVMMLVPALVALGMLRWRHRRTNLRVAIGLTRPRRIVRLSLIALAVPIGLQLAALSAAAGH